MRQQKGNNNILIFGPFDHCPGHTLTLTITLLKKLNNKELLNNEMEMCITLNILQTMNSHGRGLRHKQT